MQTSTTVDLGVAEQSGAAGHLVLLLAATAAALLPIKLLLLLLTVKVPIGEGKRGRMNNSATSANQTSAHCIHCENGKHDGMPATEDAM